jgi:hypothetical protein
MSEAVFKWTPLDGHLSVPVTFYPWVHGPPSEAPSTTSCRRNFEAALPPLSVKLHSCAITCGSDARPADMSR